MTTKAQETQHKSKQTQSTRKSPEEWTKSDTIPLPTDEAHESLKAEQADLDKPGRVSKSDAEFIDSAPGYSKNQLAHLREYYGLKEDKDTADVAPV